jgi:prophage antirepressor-like protein
LPNKEEVCQVNNDLQVFEFGDREIRVAYVNGEPAFVAKDVVEGVGNIWSGVTRIEHIPEEWRGVTSVVTPSGIQKMQVLFEQGVYFYLARCDKPAALPFQKYIAGEVLPSIRKHGAYMTPQKIEEVLNLSEISDKFSYPKNFIIRVNLLAVASTPDALFFY